MRPKRKGYSCVVLLSISTFAILCAHSLPAPPRQGGRNPADPGPPQLGPGNEGVTRDGTAAGADNFSSESPFNKRAGGQSYQDRTPHHPREGCVKGEVKNITDGEFVITGHFEMYPNVGNKPDVVVSAPVHKGHAGVKQLHFGSPQWSWHRLLPRVECGEDAMTLTIRRRRASQLALRANEASLPLSQLSPECGFLLDTDGRDLTLTASYEACHVVREDGGFVLPLLWRGTQVKMTCPMSLGRPVHNSIPSALCCPHSVTVTLSAQSAAEEVQVKVRGEWTPLVSLAEQCGYSLRKPDADLFITVPFISCGVTLRDAIHKLALRVGENAVQLTCPSPSDGEPVHTRSPDTHQTEPAAPNLGPSPRTPPSSLAPPSPPHLTSPHKDPHRAAHSSHHASTRPDLASEQQQVHPPDPSSHFNSDHIPPETSNFSLQVSSTDNMDDFTQTYLDHQQIPAIPVSEKHKATDVPPVETIPPTQVKDHSHHSPIDSSPYYHYYHHPKIPLSGPPLDPDPGPEVGAQDEHLEERPPSSSAQSPISSVHQSDAGFKSSYSEEPAPEVTPHFKTRPRVRLEPPWLRAPYLSEPDLHHYIHRLPHIYRGEAETLAQVSRDTAADTLLNHPNLGSSTSPKPTLSVNDQEDHGHWTDHDWQSEAHIQSPDSPLPEDEDGELGQDDDGRPAPIHHAHKCPFSSTELCTCDQHSTHPSMSDHTGAPSAAPPTLDTQASNSDLPSSPDNHHPFYHYYHPHYEPKSAQSAKKRESPSPSSPDDEFFTSGEHPTASPVDVDNERHQATKESSYAPQYFMYPFYHPHYFYYYYYRPGQKQQSGGSVSSEEASAVPAKPLFPSEAENNGGGLFEEHSNGVQRQDDALQRHLNDLHANSGEAAAAGGLRVGQPFVVLLEQPVTNPPCPHEGGNTLCTPTPNSSLHTKPPDSCDGCEMMADQLAADDILRRDDGNADESPVSTSFPSPSSESTAPHLASPWMEHPQIYIWCFSAMSSTHGDFTPSCAETSSPSPPHILQPQQ